MLYTDSSGLFCNSTASPHIENSSSQIHLPKMYSGPVIHIILARRGEGDEFGGGKCDLAECLEDG